MNSSAIAEIRNMLSLYPYVVDDESQYHRVPEVFAPDAVYDASHFGLGRHVGTDAIEDYLRNSAAREADPNHPFAHNIVNIHVYDVTPDRARAISRCLAVYRDGRSAMAVYKDDVLRTKRGWRISHRRMEEHVGSSGR